MEYNISDNKIIRWIGWGAAVVGIILVGVYSVIVTTAFNKQHELLNKVCDRNFPEMEYETVDGKKVLSNKSLAQIVLRVEGLQEYCAEKEGR